MSKCTICLKSERLCLAIFSKKVIKAINKKSYFFGTSSGLARSGL